MPNQAQASRIENVARAVWREPIATPAAWTRASIGGKDGFAYRLSDAHLQAIDSVLQKTRSMPPQSVERRHFDHPLLNKVLAEIKREIIHGRAVVIIQGLSPDRFSPDDLERICWGFGTHWGFAHCQNINGDRLGRIRNENMEKGYKSTGELTFHSDPFQILGLFCVQNAESGGVTKLISSLTIHNEILKARPDLLPALYQGFFYATEATDKEITTIPIPIFSLREGLVSCMFLSRYIRKAATLMGVDLPPDLEEGIQLFERTALRDDLSVEFMLEAGEMLVCHNFSTLHSRTPFTDSERKKRYLLRLWLTLSDGRPFDEAIAERGAIYDRLLLNSQVAAREAARTPAHSGT